MDLNLLIWVFPAGVLLCFRELRDEHLFIIIYAVFASYFAGVMVRLMLALTPVVCVSAAIALSSLLDVYVDVVEPESEADGATDSAARSTNVPATPGKKAKKSAPVAGATPAQSRVNKPSAAAPKKRGVFGVDTRLGVLINTTFLLLIFVLHCTWVTSSAYSSPSVVLSSRQADGSQNIIDDFREAYYWLRQNTPENAVVMSWWDYGYQIAGFADRPTLVDNNTWNNSEPFQHSDPKTELICYQHTSPLSARQCP